MKRLPALLALTLALTCSDSTRAADSTAFEAARALYAAGKLPEAREAFEKIAAADPKNAEVNFHLGELALRRDDPEAAAGFYEKSIALSPQTARYHKRLGDAYGTQAQKASIFRQPGLAKKCLAAYQRAEQLDPNDLEAHGALFEYYRQAPSLLGGGIDKATAQAEAIKRLDPARGHATFITLYLAEKDLPKAYTHAAELKKLDAHRGRQAFAQIYVGEKKFPQAFAEYDEVLKQSPDDYDALYQIGKLAATTGQFVDRGLTSLRRCLELPVPTAPGTPSRAATHWRIGNLLEKKNDPAGARAAYEAAVALDPGFAPAKDALKKLGSK